MSLAAAAQPQPGRKFCRALSAGASLAVLLNRKPGCAGAGRWRRERRPPKARVPAGTSGGEAGDRTPQGARAGPGRAGWGLLSRGWGSAVRQVAAPHPGAPARLLPFHRALGREPRGPGSRAARGGCPPRGAEIRRAALRPGTGGARVQAPAPLWLASPGRCTKSTS